MGRDGARHRRRSQTPRRTHPHYGLFANANRAENIATARALLSVAPPASDPQEPPNIATDTPRVLPCPCQRRGSRMIVIEVFAGGLRAELASDAQQDRDIMSQTALERRDFPVPMRWPHAGSDLSRPSQRGRRAVRYLIRFKRLPRCLLYASNSPVG